MFGMFILVGGGLYLAFSFWVALRLTKPITSVTLRGASLVAIFAIVAVLPVIDGIWGNINLRYVCAEEIKATQVLGKVPFPSTQIYRDKYGNIDWRAIRPYVNFRSSEIELGGRLSGIHRVTWSLIRTPDNVEVARKKQFYYRGGWLRTNGDGVGAGECTEEPPFEAVLPSMLAALAKGQF